MHKSISFKNFCEQLSRGPSVLFRACEEACQNDMQHTFQLEGFHAAQRLLKEFKDCSKRSNGVLCLNEGRRIH